MINILVLVLLLLGGVSGCKTVDSQDEGRSPSGEKLKAPRNFPNMDIQVVTQAGWSARPTAAGDQLLYVSGDRAGHRQPQVYEMDVTKKRERRVTFQDGEIFDVVAAPSGGGYYYSSSTDEIKENPDYIRNALAQLKGAQTAEANDTSVLADLAGRALPRTEIYKSSKDGNSIQRLTESPGFDGELSSSADGNAVFFSHVEAKTRSIYRYDLKTKKVALFGPRGTTAAYPTLSAKKHMAWIAAEKTEPMQWSVWVGDAHMNKGKMLYRTSNPLVDLTWHPNGETLVFAEGFSDGDGDPSALLGAHLNYEIMILDVAQSCVTRLTYHSALDLHPSVGSNERLYFDSTRDAGLTQIFQMDLKKRPPCTPTR